MNGDCECATGVLLASGECYVDPNPCDGKPLLYYHNGVCTAACDVGYYENANMCYECGFGCTECTTAASCTTCTPRWVPDAAT